MRGILNNIIRMINGYNSKEIRHFHPDGLPVPNGSHYQRGGYMDECRNNRNSYELDKSVHGDDLLAWELSGGVITFPDMVELNESVKYDIKWKTDRFLAGNRRTSGMMCRHSVGNFFKGRYRTIDGVTYGERSLSLEIDKLGHRRLMKLAGHLSREFGVKVLVKELNTNRQFLVW